MSNVNLRHNLLTYIGFCLLKKQFSYGQCQKDLESIGIRSTIPTLRKEFSLLKKEGLIEFKTYYNKPFPVLSTKGRLEIKTRLPFRRFGDFDGWKMVIFDMPDSQRTKRIILQNKLLALGFGRLSRGVYLSPHPLFTAVRRIIKKLTIEGFVTLIKTQSIENEKAKVYRAWDLKSFNEKYEQFIQKAKVATFDRKPFWPLYAKRLEKEFVLLYEKDPHLPDQFLPANWHGQEAYAIFKAISNSY